MLIPVDTGFKPEYNLYMMTNEKPGRAKMINNENVTTWPTIPAHLRQAPKKWHMFTDEGDTAVTRAVDNVMLHTARFDRDKTTSIALIATAIVMEIERAEDAHGEINDTEPCWKIYCFLNAWLKAKYFGDPIRIWEEIADRVDAYGVNRTRSVVYNIARHGIDERD